MNRITNALAALAVAATALGVASQAGAQQTFPSKPVRLVVPFTAGGTVDLLARVVGERLQSTWKQQVIVENRPGGGTVIATDYVAKSPPDGHTVLFMGNSFTINAALRSSLPYDPWRDFTPVVQLVSSPQAFVVNPALGVNTFREFLDMAKAKPGQLSYGTVGPGTTQHIAGETLKMAAGVNLTYAPFPGGAPAANALLGGHISAVIANYSEVVKQVEAGKLKALAVLSKERIEPWPNVPTVAENGFRDFEASAWFGTVVRTGPPPEIVQKLASDITAAVRAPEMREKLVAVGLYPAESSPERLRAHMRAETEKYTAIAKQAEIKVE